MSVYRRWRDRLWPWSADTAEAQPPAPPPPSARPSWADERTVNLGPLLTFGQRTGYRVPRNGGRHDR
ncbi:hypothetical protein BDK92_2199 [Micromonospora pisi]|uniref:Uncharacterized protein n=1 Tax=Micromonospora pisi TaxID=589240 RepID=A0A495JH56_9ACTN|nr:hypothetical protein BDK92_2199 [Micromonospora pisi]